MPDEQDTALRARAEAAYANAYGRYSRIKVGAALRLDDGSIVVGVNVENASYGLTNCAERTALFSAVTSRGPGLRIVAIAIASNDPRVTSPCGACRQVLNEFCPDATVLLPDGSTTTVAALLPQPFGAPERDPVPPP